MQIIASLLSKGMCGAMYKTDTLERWLQIFARGNLTFLRSPKVPILASQCPACPETPLKRDLPREKALLRRLTHATISSCTRLI